MKEKFFVATMYINWFRDTHIVSFMIIIMGPMVISAFLTIATKDYIIGFIISAVYLLVGMIISSIFNASDGIYFPEGDSLKKSVYLNRWFRCNNRLFLVEEEYDQPYGICIYGYDIKVPEILKFTSLDYNPYWTRRTSWFDVSFSRSRPLNKKEKKQYNIETLKAKILLLKDK